MPAPAKHAITLQEIGNIYSITRQAAGQLVAKYGYPTVTVADSLFAEMLGGRASALRSRLCKPEVRMVYQKSLDSAPFRLAVRPPVTRRPKA